MTGEQLVGIAHGGERTEGSKGEVVRFGWFIKVNGSGVLPEHPSMATWRIGRCGLREASFTADPHSYRGRMSGSFGEVVALLVGRVSFSVSELIYSA